MSTLQSTTTMSTTSNAFPSTPFTPSIPATLTTENSPPLTDLPPPLTDLPSPLPSITVSLPLPSDLLPSDLLPSDLLPSDLPPPDLLPTVTISVTLPPSILPPLPTPSITGLPTSITATLPLNPSVPEPTISNPPITITTGVTTPIMTDPIPTPPSPIDTMPPGTNPIWMNPTETFRMPPSRTGVYPTFVVSPAPPPDITTLSEVVSIITTDSDGSIILTAPGIFTTIYVSTRVDGMETTITKVVVNPTGHLSDDNGSPTSRFFSNKAVVAAVFLLVGLSVISICVFLIVTLRRRRRQRRIAHEKIDADMKAQSAVARPFADSDDGLDNEEDQVGLALGGELMSSTSRLVSITTSTNGASIEDMPLTMESRNPITVRGRQLSFSLDTRENPPMASRRLSAHGRNLSMDGQVRPISILSSSQNPGQRMTVAIPGYVGQTPLGGYGSGPSSPTSISQGHGTSIPPTAVTIPSSPTRSTRRGSMDSNQIPMPMYYDPHRLHDSHRFPVLQEYRRPTSHDSHGPPVSFYVSQPSSHDSHHHRLRLATHDERPRDGALSRFSEAESEDGTIEGSDFDTPGMIRIDQRLEPSTLFAGPSTGVHRNEPSAESNISLGLRDDADYSRMLIARNTSDTNVSDSSR